MLVIPRGTVVFASDCETFFSGERVWWEVQNSLGLSYLHTQMWPFFSGIVPLEFYRMLLDVIEMAEILTNSLSVLNR